MKSRKPRTIRIGPDTFLWRVHHRHQPASSAVARSCSEVFTAFSDSFPRRPLRILFPETPDHGPGFPSQSGVVVDYQEPTLHINLNRPRVARLLIELGRASGWAPSASSGEFLVPNGYHLLRRHHDGLRAALAEAAADRPQ